MSETAPLEPGSLPVFREDSYGTQKRLRVLGRWLEEYREQEGADELSVLDFGCGTGAWLAVPLARHGYRVHGVDVHEASIERARAENSLPNLSFSSEGVSQLLERGAVFDAIICSEVLEHLERPDETVRQFHALLRPGGLCLITVPNGYGPFENLRRVESQLNRFGIGYLLRGTKRGLRKMKRFVTGEKGKQGEGGDEEKKAMGYLNMDSGHVQFFRLRALKAMFESAGFTVLEQRGRSFLCGPYIDFWIDHFPSAGLFPGLNNWLGDRLPLAWVSDWMFALRRIEQSLPQ